jgi:hypothetical protein
MPAKQENFLLKFIPAEESFGLYSVDIGVLFREGVR